MPRSHASDSKYAHGDRCARCLDRGQVDSTDLNDCEEEDGSGHYEDGSQTDGGDDSSSSDEESSDDWEEDEPVLKCRRFAKEVVACLTQGNNQDPEAKNIIVCMAIHAKVIRKCESLDGAC